MNFSLLLINDSNLPKFSEVLLQITKINLNPVKINLLSETLCTLLSVTNTIIINVITSEATCIPTYLALPQSWVSHHQYMWVTTDTDNLLHT